MCLVFRVLREEAGCLEGTQNVCGRKEGRMEGLDANLPPRPSHGEGCGGETPPASAGDVGSTPDLGRPHMLWSN